MNKGIHQFVWSFTLNLFKKKKRFPGIMSNLIELEDFIKKLRPWKTDKPLIRLGSDHDGGYLVPDDLEGIDLLISPGIGNVTKFEKDCAERGMQVHLIDASVSEIPDTHPNFVFHPVFLGVGNNEVPFSKFLSGLDLESYSGDWLLQMDIEGAEWENLIEIPVEVLNRFRILVLEFHQMDNLFNAPYFDLVKKVFDKLSVNFEIVHIHPNNFGNKTQIEGIEIPRYLEFTFLRKDRIGSKEPARQFPHPLDQDCLSGGESLHLPSCWYDF